MADNPRQVMAARLIALATLLPLLVGILYSSSQHDNFILYSSMLDSDYIYVKGEKYSSSMTHGVFEKRHNNLYNFNIYKGEGGRCIDFEGSISIGVPDGFERKAYVRCSRSYFFIEDCIPFSSKVCSNFYLKGWSKIDLNDKSAKIPLALFFRENVGISEIVISNADDIEETYAIDLLILRGSEGLLK